MKPTDTEIADIARAHVKAHARMLICDQALANDQLRCDAYSQAVALVNYSAARLEVNQTWLQLVSACMQSEGDADE